MSTTRYNRKKLVNEIAQSLLSLLEKEIDRDTNNEWLDGAIDENVPDRSPAFLKEMREEVMHLDEEKTEFVDDVVQRFIELVERDGIESLEPVLAWELRKKAGWVA